jgi:hypothetical protein
MKIKISRIFNYNIDKHYHRKFLILISRDVVVAIRLTGKHKIQL